MPFGHWVLFTGTEPFYTGVYSLLWWPFILVADFLVYRLRGRSILSSRPWEFFLLALWSTPLWQIFEMFNLRLQNWYYVQVPFELNASFIILAFAYATVLPGVFEVADLLEGLIEKISPAGRLTARSFKVGKRLLWAHMIIGIAMLILPMVWPDVFYCLIWGFAFFIFDTICYLRGGRSLLGQLAAGDNTMLMALLVSGLICGGVWEGWNFFARTKWIYTVPGFENLKLGEMPMLGFLGFPPFVLECYAMVNFLNLFRGGRSWELDATENKKRPGMKRKLVITLLPIMLLFMGIADYYNLTITTSSFNRRLDRFFAERLDEEEQAALRRIGANHSHLFLRLDTKPEALDEADWQYMREICTLAELRGMGLRYATVLWNAGIRKPGDLAGRHAGEILEILKAQLSESEIPYPAQVRVWLRAADNVISE
ncbi:MAG: hypothetical protein ACLFUS_15620 [Candidatus Sumerlaeia bacterium]